MRTSHRLLAFGVALGIGACGGDAAETGNGAATEDTAASEQTAESDAPAHMHEMMLGLPMTSEFRALGDSGVTGEATVVGLGSQTAVTVRLAGMAPNVPRPGHIHTGTCEAIGGVVQPLDEVAVDGTGNGMMTMSVGVPIETLADGRHIIVYHGEGGGPIACAPIPAHTM